MLVKKGRHSEISLNYKLKILAKKVNLLIVSRFQYSASAIIVVLKLQDNEYKSSFLVY